MKEDRPQNSIKIDTEYCSSNNVELRVVPRNNEPIGLYTVYKNGIQIGFITTSESENIVAYLIDGTIAWTDSIVDAGVTPEKVQKLLRGCVWINDVYSELVRGETKNGKDNIQSQGPVAERFG